MKIYVSSKQENIKGSLANLFSPSTMQLSCKDKPRTLVWNSSQDLSNETRGVLVQNNKRLTSISCVQRVSQKQNFNLSQQQTKLLHLKQAKPPSN